MDSPRAQSKDTVIFNDIDKLILKFIQRGQRPRVVTNIEEEDGSWRTDTIQLQDLVEATVSKTLWHWWKEQANRETKQTERPC